MKLAPLGSYAKDEITGIKGVIMGRTEQLNGNIQYSIQPAGDGVTYPDAFNVDWHNIQVDTSVPTRPCQPSVEVVKVVLGSVIEDTASGIRGMATSKHVHLNGCIHYSMIPKSGPREIAPMIRCEYIPQERVVVVKDFEVAVKRVTPEKPPGGPSSRMSSSKSPRL